MYLPSLPLLERVYGATTAQVQFTLATFFVGYALGQSLYGPITDRYGRKPPPYFSLLLFVLSSIACATTRSIAALAFFRLLQAIGACGRRSHIARHRSRPVSSGFKCAAYSRC
jgi:DHA1 family bicyclomycin/chloramphenicol resistance-like MFS transporter